MPVYEMAFLTPATDGIGFLNLPVEIRHMIYRAASPTLGRPLHLHAVAPNRHPSKRLRVKVIHHFDPRSSLGGSAGGGFGRPGMARDWIPTSTIVVPWQLEPLGPKGGRRRAPDQSPVVELMQTCRVIYIEIMALRWRTLSLGDRESAARLADITNRLCDGSSSPSELGGRPRRLGSLHFVRSLSLFVHIPQASSLFYTPQMTPLRWWGDLCATLGRVCGVTSGPIGDNDNNDDDDDDGDDDEGQRSEEETSDPAFCVGTPASMLQTLRICFEVNVEQDWSTSDATHEMIRTPMRRASKFLVQYFAALRILVGRVPYIEVDVLWRLARQEIDVPSDHWIAIWRTKYRPASTVTGREAGCLLPGGVLDRDGDGFSLVYKRLTIEDEFWTTWLHGWSATTVEPLESLQRRIGDGEEIYSP